MGIPENKRDEAREQGQLAIGRNAAIELLGGSRQTECVYICDDAGGAGQPISRIVAMAKQKGVPVKKVNVKKLDSLSGGMPHQGVVALAAAFTYSTVEQILSSAKQSPALIVIADGIEDPHNLGAIIRTAEAAGANGLIIPKRGSVGLTSVVGRTSAGAVEYLPVARVTNLVATMEDLKKQGVWIYGAHMGGQRWDSADLKSPTAIVVGSEGAGISRLVREHCDVLMGMPMCGKVNSLNASVAAGILLFEAVRQRTASV